MQIIGLCRFSYPSLGGFQVEHENLEERIAYLYAPARLEERFALFETVHLPGIRAQTNPDFVYIVVTGEQLPQRYKDRLNDLLSDVPQARLLALPPMKHRPTMADSIRAHVTRADGPVVQFRLDDDDGVAIDFIEKLRTCAHDLKSLFEARGRTAIDFNRGYLMAHDNDGLKVSEVYQRLWTPALAVMFRQQAKTTVMNYAHHKLDQIMPTVSFSGETMFVRSYNRYNDSPFPKRLTNDLAAPDTEILKDLKKRFCVQPEVVARAYQAARDI